MQLITRSITLALLTGASVLAQTPLPNGPYRGEFQTPNGGVPFNFEIKSTGSIKTAYLLNADGREELTGVQQQGDSLFIPIPLYDASLRFARKGGKLTGVYHANSGGKDLPVTAEFGRTDRYEKGAASTVSLNGTWDIGIQRSARDPTDINQTVGVFAQKGSRVTGTILTTTGDYRYLDGQVTGNEFRLN